MDISFLHLNEDDIMEIVSTNESDVILDELLELVSFAYLRIGKQPPADTLCKVVDKIAETFDLDIMSL